MATNNDANDSLRNGSYDTLVRKFGLPLLFAIFQLRPAESYRSFRS